MGVKVGRASRAPARWRPCAVRISLPQAERMDTMSRICFSSGSPWLINACAHTPAAFRPGPLRPAPRARRLRRRLRRRHQGPALARHRPAGAAGPHQPEHRGACGCEANTGDGAGILIQMPDRFLRKETAPLGIALPAERRVRRRPRVPAARRRRARARSRRLIERIVARGRAAACSAGATCRPTTRRSAPSAVARRAGLPSSSSSAAAPTPTGAPTTTRVRAQAVRHPQAHRARGRSRCALAERHVVLHRRACRRRR